ncbi:LamG-like jellyroll fold domain-containing protein [Micromonospora sp. NPDC047730]|uniref:LamG-like jellyroll fold domain-containing protein n=1 Tax=Micromonospora sp. NPDC047730 TaxID=3364253 RepID=UPI0037246318
MLAVLLWGGLLPLVPPTGPAIAAPTAPGGATGAGPSTEAVTEAEASAAAQRSGQRVEVLSGRSETSEVYALPSGRFELVQHLRPVRARQQGRWTPVDTTLVRTGDVLSPVSSTVGLRLSAGGAGPLVRMTRAGRELALSWPDRLPVPTIEQDTATYAEVLPGVDLRVRARVDGFSHLLVVKNAAAARHPALAKLAFGLDAPGLAVRADATGFLTVTDAASGGGVFEGLSPKMWDAGPPAVAGAADGREDPAAGPPPGARTARLGVAVRPGGLELTPDQALLRGAETRYPVYIDPVWKTVQASARAMVSSGYPTTSFYDFDGKSTEGVGLCDVQYDGACVKDQKKRLFYRVPISAVAGRYIISTEFVAYETHAYNCSNPTSVQLWHISGFATGSTWNSTDDNWIKHLTSRDVAYCSRTPVEFGGTALRDVVRAAAGRSDSTISFGLRAYSESTMDWWKRFADDAFMRIEYNTPPPQTPMSKLSMSPGGPCVGSSAAPRVNQRPTFYAILTDPDSGSAAKLYAQVEVRQSGTLLWTSALTGPKTTGSTFQILAPSTLPQNVLLAWHVRTWDGYQWSPWSSSGAPTGCYFYYDTTAPAAPVISSTAYPRSDPENPDDPWYDGVGRYGTFTLSTSNTDVNRYWVGLNTTPTAAGEYRPATNGGPVTVPIVPDQAGVNFLYVKVLDTAGNVSASATYLFRVSAGRAPKAYWHLDEPAGSTTLTAGTRPGEPAVTAQTYGGVTLGADGQDRTALRGDGSTGYAETSGTVVDTSASYAVATWVKLDHTNTFATAVSQDGTVVSGFYLQYVQDNNRWSFSLTNADAVQGGVRALSAAAPTTGEWTHLVGVYDSVARKARLYVNGVLNDEKPFTVTWNATGPMGIGRARHNGAKVDFFPGAIDDVRVFDRIVTANEVDDLFRQHPVLTGRWKLNSDGTDGSGLNRTLALADNARIDQAAGWLGEPPGGLVLDGVGDYAATTGPVVGTHQSFTVAGWVTSPTAPTRRAAVFSQAGTTNSGFTLRYAPDAVNGTGGWQVEMPDSDAAGATMQTAGHSAYQWQLPWDHLAIVYDAFADVLHLYVNGQLQQTEANVSTRLYTLGFNATGPLQLGRAKTGGVWGEYWAGVIDDVWAFSGALSPEQVQMLAGHTELPSDSPF